VFEEKTFSRRSFVRGSAAVTALAAAGKPTSAKPEPAKSSDSSETVPGRPLGKTGAKVSILGVGGFHLGSTKDQNEANQLVAQALDAGVTFFDNCWDYHDGLSEERLGVALAGKRDKAFVMTKVCTHGRTKDVAMQQLEQSLRRLRTDHLDLWQIHEVIYYNDPDLIFAANGAIEALVMAKQQGKVRFVGFTGHKSPAIHLKMLSYDFPFDTVQMPLNCLDSNFQSFEKNVLPEAERRGIAVLGMKSMGGSGELISNGVATPEEALRYAMSLPVATTISGMDSLEILAQNLAIARNFKPMSTVELQSLRDRVRAFAEDGRYELFKTSKKYDGKVGREQHHYPTAEKLPV
jgi:aryl-alcohol dehydrogenase-like predicted oxidoreductase